MGNKKIIVWITILFVLSSLTLYLSLMRLDPRSASWMGLIFLIIVLWLFSASFLSLFLLAARAIRKKNISPTVALRQAGLFSTAIIVALYLARFNLLTWLNTFLLIGILILLEIYFLGRDDNNRYESQT